MYDPSIRYMGPQGKLEWLFKYIPPIPPGCQELDEPWNKVFFGHDEDYSGYIPWWRFLKRYLAMKDRLEADTKMLDGLISAVDESQLTDEFKTIAKAYAQIIFEAIDEFGWSFYKTCES